MHIFSRGKKVDTERNPIPNYDMEDAQMDSPSLEKGERGCFALSAMIKGNNAQPSTAILLANMPKKTNIKTDHGSYEMNSYAEIPLQEIQDNIYCEPKDDIKTFRI